MFSTNFITLLRREDFSSHPGAAMSISFLGSTVDASGHRVSAKWSGNAAVTFSGAKFDGDDDYVTVSDFTYEKDDGKFTVSFWMTKEDCTGGVYEYMYSHMSSIQSDTMWTKSGLNIYLGCEKSGGGQSTLGGAVIRYSLVDTKGKEAMFDTKLHDAGDFDAVTKVWVHVVLAVTPKSLATYDDGSKMKKEQYGFFKESNQNSNLAQPDPSDLGDGFGVVNVGAVDGLLVLGVLVGRAAEAVATDERRANFKADAKVLAALNLGAQLEAPQ